MTSVHASAPERWMEVNKRKPNRITCRITEITITILNHDYTATEPRWQSTIDMMKSSTEQRIFKKKREIVESDQSSRPTCY